MGTGRVVDRLRDRIIGELHLGRLHAGDRLAPVREVAAELGVGVRAAARAYRQLEREGLVEVRSRSGVYVAPQERLSAEVLEETARWLTDTLVEGLKRRIAIPGLPDFVRRCTATVRPKCVLLESTDDHLVVLGAELRDELGYEVSPVKLGPEWPGRAVAKAVSVADVLVTTTYHAAAARLTAEAVGRPLVVITVHPDVPAALERRLRAGPLTVVCVDPAFGERVKGIYAERFPDRIRVVPVDDPACPGPRWSQPVLLTLAARQRLGERAPPSLLPHSPSISPESARELAALLVRLNIAAEAGR